MQGQLLLLNQISDELNKDLDLDNMLQRVIDLTVEHFDAAAGSIMLLDEDRRVSKNILQQQNLSHDRTSRILGQVLTEGFAGWVLDHGRGDVILDTQDDGRWVNYPDQPYEARAAIATPLTRRSRVLGVLTMTHTQSAHFKEEDLPLLNAIAGQAAIALENAQLFYQTELERSTLSAIINSTQDAILVTDPINHTLLLMNPAAKKILQVRRFQEWRNRPLKEICTVEDFVEALTSEAAQTEQEIQLPDSRTMLCNMVDVPNVGRLTLMHDISPLKALDKMKSEFVIAFTHDLAAPLAAIKGYIELLNIDGSLTAQQVEDLHAIKMSADQIRNLITDLQELTRLETLKNMLKWDVQLNETVEKTFKTFQPIAEAKNVQLTLDIKQQQLTAYGNPALISRAVDNLVENAIKYTRSNGAVGLSMCADEDEVFIAVTDTGLGIPEAKLPEIFEKFFRAHPPDDNQIPGSGLGLSIVKTIIERHGGQISVESKVDVGSTFTIALPIHHNGDEQQQALA